MQTAFPSGGLESEQQSVAATSVRAAIFRVFVTRGRYADEFSKRRLPSVRAALFC
jgi:hypothetical protein